MYESAATLVIDFYLDDKRMKEREKIQDLVNESDAESWELLLGYVREGMRLNPQVRMLYFLNAEST